MATLQQDETRNSYATHMHVYLHRYPVAKETIRDKLTYHALMLFEWNHGRFTTLVELGFLQGTGGHQGRSNWVEDKLAPTPKLFQAIKEVCPGMIIPHRSD